MKTTYDRIGFMQGRLSPLIGDKIQAFPWPLWQEEFQHAQKIGIHMMEWTLDQDRLYENPLMTTAGQQEIRNLCLAYDITIPSLTGDCFMQAPFWKVRAQAQAALKTDFLAVAIACSKVGIEMVVVPLVDNGRLDTVEQENVLVEFLLTQSDFLRKLKVKVLFESDFSPPELSRFIDRLPTDLFGINYDIGNSAALGMDPMDEFGCYGPRITNVHVKDRILGGTTVVLGNGNADFSTVFSLLHKQNFNGNYIMQTARADDGDHSAALKRYMQMIARWVEVAS